MDLDAVIALVSDTGIDVEDACALAGFTEATAPLDFLEAARRAEILFGSKMTRVLAEAALVRGSVSAASFLLRSRAKHRKAKAQLELSFEGPVETLSLPDNGRGPAPILESEAKPAGLVDLGFGRTKA